MHARIHTTTTAKELWREKHRKESSERRRRRRRRRKEKIVCTLFADFSCAPQIFVDECVHIEYQHSRVCACVWECVLSCIGHFTKCQQKRKFLFRFRCCRRCCCCWCNWFDTELNFGFNCFNAKTELNERIFLLCDLESSQTHAPHLRAMDFDGDFFVGRRNFGDFHNFYSLFLNDSPVRFTSAVSMAQRLIVYAKRIDTHVCQSNTHAQHSIAQHSTHTHRMDVVDADKNEIESGSVMWRRWKLLSSAESNVYSLRQMPKLRNNTTSGTGEWQMQNEQCIRVFVCVSVMFTGVLNDRWYRIWMCDAKVRSYNRRKTCFFWWKTLSHFTGCGANATQSTATKRLGVSVSMSLLVIEGPSEGSVFVSGTIENDKKKMLRIQWDLEENRSWHVRYDTDYGCHNKDHNTSRVERNEILDIVTVLHRNDLVGLVRCHCHTAASKHKSVHTE